MQQLRETDGDVGDYHPISAFSSSSFSSGVYSLPARSTLVHCCSPSQYLLHHPLLLLRRRSKRRASPAIPPPRRHHSALPLCVNHPSGPPCGRFHSQKVPGCHHCPDFLDCWNCLPPPVVSSLALAAGLSVSYCPSLDLHCSQKTDSPSHLTWSFRCLLGERKRFRGQVSIHIIMS